MKNTDCRFSHSKDMKDPLGVIWVTNWGYSRSSAKSLFYRSRVHTTSCFSFKEIFVYNIPFWDRASYLSKVTSFSYSTCIWRPVAVTPLEFHQDICVVICYCRLDRTPTCVEHTNQQTHRHNAIAYTALA